MSPNVLMDKHMVPWWLLKGKIFEPWQQPQKLERKPLSPMQRIKSDSKSVAERENEAWLRWLLLRNYVYPKCKVLKMPGYGWLKALFRECGIQIYVNPQGTFNTPYWDVILNNLGWTPSEECTQEELEEMVAEAWVQYRFGTDVKGLMAKAQKMNAFAFKVLETECDWKVLKKLFRWYSNLYFDITSKWCNTPDGIIELTVFMHG